MTGLTKTGIKGCSQKKTSVQLYSVTFNYSSAPCWRRSWDLLLNSRVIPPVVLLQESALCGRECRWLSLAGLTFALLSPQAEQLHRAEHLVPPHPQAQAPAEETEDAADRQGKAGPASPSQLSSAFGVTQEGIQDRSVPAEFTGKAPCASSLG